jgi:hypothetical protein
MTEVPNTLVTGTIRSVDIPQICFPMPLFGVSPYRASAKYVIQVQNFTTSGGPYLFQGEALDVTYFYNPLPQVQPGDLVQAYGWFYQTFDFGCDSTMRIGPSYQGSYLSVLNKAEAPQTTAIHYHNYTLPYPLLAVDFLVKTDPNNSHLTIRVQPPPSESEVPDWVSWVNPISSIQSQSRYLHNSTGWIVVSSSTSGNGTRLDLELRNVTYTRDQVLWHVDLHGLIPWTTNSTISGQALVATWDDFGYTKLTITAPANAYGLSYNASQPILSFRLVNPHQLDMALNPANLAVSQGSSTSVEVTFPRIGDLRESSLVLTATSPAGIKIDFSPNPISLASNQTVKSTATIIIDKTVPLGNYTLNLTASYGPVTQESSIKVSVTSGCLIATAAYGSELASPVQYLRNFRDRDVDRTYLGHRFLSAFNAWYYSWAPSVAKMESGSSELRAGVRTVIMPLMGSLFVSSLIFELARPLNPEAAILIAGVAASALLGLVYVTPIALTTVYAAKRRMTRRTILCVFVLGVVLAFVGTLSNGRTDMIENATAIIVIETMLLAPTILVRRFVNCSSS